MSETNPKCFHLSASSIQSFKSCPQRFRLAYREGLRVAADTESQRMGTNWHKMHEAYAFYLADRMAPSDPMLRADHALNCVVQHLNHSYEKKPASKTVQEWALERQILLTCFVGYLWRWQEDPVEVLASEVPFELPIHMPKTGLPLPTSECVRVGKIDHVIRWQGMVGCLERKSTSRSIEAASDYWDKAKKDTQVSMYALAFRDMANAGVLPASVVEVLYGDDQQGTESQTLPAESSGSFDPEQGVQGEATASGETTDIVCEETRVCGVPRETQAVPAIPSPRSGHEAIHGGIPEVRSESKNNLGGDSEVRRTVCKLPLVPTRTITVSFGNCLYDVWHKPTIKPKMLTQAETGKFVETAEYYGQKFNVQCLNTLDVKLVTVNDEECEIEPGKKGFAIRETVEMYGARLLADIYERPDFYYARREIARTDQELDRFRVELFNIYQMQKTFSKTGCWFENESQCRATFPCPFIGICYGPGADAVCDGKTTPNGYKRIFVDLKVKGEAIEDE